MNQRKNWFIKIGILIFTLLLLIPTEIKAADSYEEPKIFYDTCLDKTYHIEFTDGEYIYYATKAKTASSTAYKRYATLGWQIRLEGGGSSVSVDLKIDGNVLKRVKEDYNSDGYLKYLL